MNSGVSGYSTSPVRRRNKYTRDNECSADVLPIFIKPQTKWSSYLCGRSCKNVGSRLKSYLMDRGIIPYYMFHIQKRRIISFVSSCVWSRAWCLDNLMNIDMDKLRRTVLVNEKFVTLKSMTEIDNRRAYIANVITLLNCYLSVNTNW